MNLIDLLLLLVILASAYSGYRKGFIAGVIELVGWLGSLVLAFLLYPYIGAAIEKYTPNMGAAMLGITFLLTIFLVRVVIGQVLNLLIDLVPQGASQSLTDRIFGLVPGILSGLVYAALLSGLLLLLPLSETLTTKAAQSPVARSLNGVLATVEKMIAPGFSERIQRSMNGTAVETGSNEFIKLGFKIADAPPRPDLEARMLGLVNRERVKAGLAPLEADTTLRTVARKHSADMFARGYFSHYTPEMRSPFDRINAASISYLAAGENLAIAPNLVLAHEGLMKSPGHRANILQPAFGRVGIGILDGGIYGLMVTQNFRD
jgi:uncharacterized protein YkwD